MASRRGFARRLTAVRRLLPGRPAPLGAVPDAGGTNFAVHSDIAEAVAICIFESDGTETQWWLGARTGSIHHGYVTNVPPGTRYGLRVEGPWDPSEGLWCNSAKLLIDPYAHAIVGRVEWDRAVYGYQVQDPNLPEPHDSAPFVPRCLVVDQTFDWADDARPRHPWSETVIYETHVRALTMLHPEVPEPLRGTYLGLASPPVVDHLERLGITAVELLPVQQFVHDHALIRRGLRNHWGYQPIGYFAPHGEYAASGDAGDQVTEFKQMVQTLHGAGIEVILDVVYNHTGESHHLGPNLAFRGIDNPAYYRLSDEDRRHYLDFAGTGNTINTDHPAVLRMIADSLRHWATTYHVDGFRFDLATTLARHRLEFDPAGPFLGLVHQDPVLNDLKLIAEPWDVGPGGYRLGAFPAEWREWNDRYRDTVRDFWRGKSGIVGDLASRISGSSDAFRHGDKRPATASVNFVTSHDGYTLRDLVSYERRHNEANGEGNRDGHHDNRSWNSGVEGTTDDAEIVELRMRRRRAMIATLLISQGVPMLLGGDEIGRTQHGNNNAYAQDNEVSWYDWESADHDFAAYVAHLVRLRRDHPVLRRAAWLRGLPAEGSSLEDVGWFAADGGVMTIERWRDPRLQSLTVFLNGMGLTTAADEPADTADSSFLVMLNAASRAVTFTVPGGLGVGGWNAVVDSSDADPGDIAELHDGAQVTVEPFGVVALMQTAHL
jgi:isoamylase